MKNDILTQSFIDLRDRLHRSALGFLRNEEDAADALQDTFFRLWKSGAVATDSEARNKLFAVLRNVCIYRLRKPRTAGLRRPRPPGGPHHIWSVGNAAANLRHGHTRRRGVRGDSLEARHVGGGRKSEYEPCKKENT